MSTYPTSLAPQLNQVPEDVEAGQITPSQGGIIGTGHEFDMTISQPTQQLAPSSHPPTAPVPRASTSSSHRPRPVSMPPQAFAPGPPATDHGSVSGTSNSTRDRERSQDENTHRRRQRDETRSSRSNRVLGDYTLSKTLGAGSMGKVKLAVHNITGEKVWSSATYSSYLFLY